MAKGANDKGVMNSVAQFLTGGFLTSEKVKGFLPIFAVILLLSLVSTEIGYRAYHLQKQNAKLEKEIKDLRAEYVSTQQILINKKKLINLREQIEEKDLGLKESKTPAYKISVNGK